MKEDWSCIPASPAATPLASAADRSQFHLARGLAQADGSPGMGKLYGGQLEVSKPCAYRCFKEITDPAYGDFDTEYGRNTSVCVTTTSFTQLFSYTRKVLVRTDRPSDHKFTDETGDRYTLRITGARLEQDHAVRYRSKKPAIVDILFTLPE